MPTYLFNMLIHTSATMQTLNKTLIVVIVPIQMKCTSYSSSTTSH